MRKPLPDSVEPGSFFPLFQPDLVDAAISPANIFSMSEANSLFRITAFTSSLLEKLQKSILVEPTVDQTLSITAVFACSRTSRRSYNFTPDFRRSE